MYKGIFERRDFLTFNHEAECRNSKASARFIVQSVKNILVSQFVSYNCLEKEFTNMLYTILPIHKCCKIQIEYMKLTTADLQQLLLISGCRFKGNI